MEEQIKQSSTIECGVLQNKIQSHIKMSVATVHEALFLQMTSLFKAANLRQHFHFLKSTFAMTLSSLYE